MAKDNAKIAHTLKSSVKVKQKSENVKVEQKSYIRLSKNDSFLPKDTPLGHSHINGSLQTVGRDMEAITVDHIKKFTDSPKEKIKYDSLKNGFSELSKENFSRFTGTIKDKKKRTTLNNGVLTLFTVVNSNIKRMEDLKDNISHYSKFIRVSLVVVCKPKEKSSEFFEDESNITFLKNLLQNKDLKFDETMELQISSNIELFIVDGHKEGLASCGYSRGCAIQLMDMYYGETKNFVVFISDDRRSLRTFEDIDNKSKKREIVRLNSDGFLEIINQCLSVENNDTVWSALNHSQCGRKDKDKIKATKVEDRFRDLSQIIWYKSSTMKSVLEEIGNYPIFPILEDYIFAGILLDKKFRVRILHPEFGYIKSDCNNSSSLCRQGDTKGEFKMLYDKSPVTWYYAMLAVHTALPFLLTIYDSRSIIYTYSIRFSSGDEYKMPYLLEGYNWGEVEGSQKPVGGSQTQFLTISNYIYTRLKFDINWDDMNNYNTLCNFFKDRENKRIEK